MDMEVDGFFFSSSRSRPREGYVLRDSYFHSSILFYALVRVNDVQYRAELKAAGSLARFEVNRTAAASRRERTIRRTRWRSSAYYDRDFVPGGTLAVSLHSKFAICGEL